MPLTSPTLMFRRRAALALTLVILVLASSFDASAARAQSVDEAARQADQAATDVDSAYQVVASSLANRSEIESRLLAALGRYAEASAAVEAATVRLDRLQFQAESAADESVEVETALQEQAVSAYIHAMSAGTQLVLASDSAENAMITEEFFSAGTSNSLERIDALTARRAELDRLAVEYRLERERVELLELQLASESEELERLFEQADAEVAAAYRRARAADLAYQQALTAIDRARAAEERRRQEETATTTTTPDTVTTTTTPPAGPTTTAPPTTTPPNPPPPPGPAVERWRPLVSTHFASDLVDDAMRIIDCESNGDPEAVNPYSSASGLFQFLPSTWAVASVKAGVGDRSVFDAEANIIAASWLAEYYRANRGNPWLPWACRHYL